MKKCPLIKKPCIESGCTFWTHLLGTNPNTGLPVDEFGCSISWLPILLIETARHTRGVQAAVESTRNEIVSRQDILNSAVRSAQRQVDRTETKSLPDGETNGR
ncbi:hypothetical protein E2553_00275 [Paraburkholderia dipogonis]|uniref:Uncharacterized protein n=1 Tax=Paraburkholderia dipogonis TaxID=1211383 RepID=A0A4Y8N190_9BURK|nr:hypothetical protein [Paraburkholderia dipogonis]TFE43606.1 hypothetical protein E2553_00275 [Paraburkholderia dipogonis]